MAKRDRVVLLVLLAEKIITACEKITVLFQARSSVEGGNLGLRQLADWSHHYAIGNGQGIPTPPASGLFTMDGAAPSLGDDLNLAGTSKDWQELFLGDFEITCPREWECLVHALILLQLTSLMEMLADLKSVDSTVLGETQRAILTRAIIRVYEIKKAISSI